jgi:hypothetical protein
MSYFPFGAPLVARDSMGVLSIHPSFACHSEIQIASKALALCSSALSLFTLYHESA